MPKIFSDLSLPIIQSIITDETQSAFKTIPKPDFEYNVVVSGCIGAGKSTLLELISHLLKQTGIQINPLPEFVNMPLGIDILKERLAAL